MRTIKLEASEFGDELAGFTCCAQLEDYAQHEDDGARVLWVDWHQQNIHSKLADAVGEWWTENGDSYIDKYLEDEAASQDDYDHHSRVDDARTLERERRQ